MSEKADQDSVVRYSVQCQEHLLMEGTGESAGLGERISEGAAEISYFDSFTFGELPSYSYIDPTRSPFCFAERKRLSFADDLHDDSAVNVSNEGGSINHPVHHEEHSYAKPAPSSSRRDRPEKGTTSTLCSAKYSRRYRERRKNELLARKTEHGKLTEQIKFLHAENRHLTAGFGRLIEHVDDTGNMVEGHARTCPDPLPPPHFFGLSNEKDSTDDVSNVRSSIPQ